MTSELNFKGRAGIIHSRAGAVSRRHVESTEAREKIETRQVCMENRDKMIPRDGKENLNGNG